MIGITEELIAKRVSKELKEGMYVSVGFGMPMLVPQFVSGEKEVIFQSDNGILDLGSPATPGNEDYELVDARGTPVTLRDGASLFDSALSFAMIRGGHIDISILGAFQVSGKGDLANWRRSSIRNDENSKSVLGNIGGAMDLAQGARRTWAMMKHTTAQGDPKIVEECTYALTARGVISLIFTNLCVMEVTDEGLQVKELAPGITQNEVKANTGCNVIFAKDIKAMEL